MVSFRFVVEVGGSSAAEITFFFSTPCFVLVSVLAFFLFVSFLFFTMLSNFCNGNVFLVHTNTYS